MAFLILPFFFPSSAFTFNDPPTIPNDSEMQGWHTPNLHTPLYDDWTSFSHSSPPHVQPLSSSIPYADLANQTHQLLDSLPPLTSTTPSSAIPSRALIAMDCTTPQDVIPLTLLPDFHCSRPHVPDTHTPMTYVVLQEAHNIRFTARRCHLLETRILHYCGNYDHQTYITRSHYQVPRTVSATECARLWNTKQYTDAKDKVHHLIEGLNVLRWEEHGTTSFTSTDVECSGATVTIEGHKRQQLMTHIQWQLLLVHEQLLLNHDNVITIQSKQLRTTCHPDLYECQTSIGTLVWNVSDVQDRCHLYQTRVATGYDVSANQTTIFISTDGSMIRLKHEATVFRCNEPVIRTNYHRLYLSLDQTNPNFQRRLPTSEMSISIYASQQDNFLYGEITTMFTREFNKVLHYLCQQHAFDKQNNLVQRAAQIHAATSSVTISLGDSYYATAAGEIWYKFRCRKLIVAARDTTKCFTAMPVTLASVDRFHYLQAHDLLNSTVEFFLTPYSRILTTIGVEQPCLSHVTPTYRNLQGQWLTATPNIKAAPTPHPLPSFAVPPYLYQDQLAVHLDDMDKAGIYTMTDRAKWDLYLQTPQLVDDFVVKIGRQMIHYSDHDKIHVNDIFPDEYIPTFTIHSLPAMLWDSFLKLGDVASVFLAFYMLYRIITWIADLIFRWKFIYESGKGSLRRYVAAIAAPALAHFYHPRDDEVVLSRVTPYTVDDTTRKDDDTTASAPVTPFHPMYPQLPPTVPEEEQEAWL